MKSHLRVIRLTFCIFCLSLIARLSLADAENAQSLARRLIETSGVEGGMVVHLGCGDGRLTAALRVDDKYVVHGLDSDPDAVARAREHVRSQGIYGPVSVETFSGSRLPYTENLINLAVVDEPGDVPMAEVLRVLVPEGVALVRDGDNWNKTVKPRPDSIDEWSHFLHDASGNAVARDSRVGHPRSVQWIAPPLWLRSHETPSGIQASVSAGGRLFYFFDEGIVGITDERLPARWSLVGRDAFNGKLLWKRELGPWGWREWNRQKYAGKDWTKLRAGRVDVPSQNQRRIVADGDRLYVTLAYRAPLSILDAATGKTIATIDATHGTREILVTDGVALAYTSETAEEVARRRGDDGEAQSALVAVDAKSGEVLWRNETGAIRSMALASAGGRVVFLTGKDLVALDLESGAELWRTPARRPSVRTLAIVDDTVVLQSGTHVAAHNAADGKFLWEQTGPPVGMGEVDDLFVVDGLVWRGMACVTDDGKPANKSPNSLVIGWDLRTGEEKKRILVNNLRSPEHHHRCYRNKATEKYLISSFEGAEFLDWQGDDHGMNNFVRGACRYGMMPCNGMLYVPPDQCFCQPGAKLLGYAALTAGPEEAFTEVPDASRLERGPAFDNAEVGLRNAELREGIAEAAASNIPTSALRIPHSKDWPTFRYNSARGGATPAAVSSDLAVAWKVQLEGKLSAPVVAEGKVFVAQVETHTVHALDVSTGEVAWHFTAGGRIDSPPTIHDGLVLFGSADGRVYCLRADDGQLVWRFLAAPVDRRVGHFDQIESAWPVHGSVLLHEGVAYVAAGRSTYLDGGIRLWGLDPATGKILHRGLLEGPHRTIDGERDVAFFILGANSDVLVSEGGHIYMRQKKLTPELEEIDVEVLSSKGAQDVGLHVFSTAGLLDDSWYNRTFWMYSGRWPGFQLANQAPKTGQLLVVDDETTYAVRVFYFRNCHSPMFFPGKQGYLVFADANTNEPQIVGEEGARDPVRWLPMSDYSRGRGNEVRKLDSSAFGGDKGIGYTRAEPPLWMTWLPVRVQAMVKAGNTLFVAGPPDMFDPDDPFASFESRKGAQLVALSTTDGKKLSQIDLATPPVFDGLIAAQNRLFAALRDGTVVCLGEKR